MQWLNQLRDFVWAFIALLGGLAILFNVIQPIANGVWTTFGANAMTLVAIGVVSLAAAGIGHWMSGSGGTGN